MVIMSESKTPKTQRDKFEEAARKLKTDDSEERFDQVLGRVAVQANTRIFCLWPIEGQEGHRDWAASALAPVRCWVRARNAADARAYVMLATIIAAKVVPGDIAPVKTSPWTNPALTGCSIDEPSLDIPEGVVVTSEGQTISVSNE